MRLCSPPEERAVDVMKPVSVGNVKVVSTSGNGRRTMKKIEENHRINQGMLETFIGARPTRRCSSSSKDATPSKKEATHSTSAQCKAQDKVPHNDYSYVGSLNDYSRNDPSLPSVVEVPVWVEDKRDEEPVRRDCLGRQPSRQHASVQPSWQPPSRNGSRQSASHNEMDMDEGLRGCMGMKPPRHTSMQGSSCQTSKSTKRVSIKSTHTDKPSKGWLAPLGCVVGATPHIPKDTTRPIKCEKVPVKINKERRGQPNKQVKRQPKVNEQVANRSSSKPW